MGINPRGSWGLWYWGHDQNKLWKQVLLAVFVSLESPSMACRVYEGQAEHCSMTSLRATGQLLAHRQALLGL